VLIGHAPPPHLVSLIVNVTTVLMCGHLDSNK
jgi:hypothetical protein